PDAEGAETAWRALVARDRDTTDEVMKRARAALGEDRGAWITLRGAPTVPASWGLGPAAVLFAPVLGGLTTWEGTWRIAPERLNVTMEGTWTLETPMAADWFAPAGELVPLAAALPKSQTVSLRGRLNLDKLQGIPDFLRTRILPERLPGMLGRLLPKIEPLLTLLQGDFAVTLLGLDAGATVDHALRAEGQVGTLSQLVHTAWLVGISDPAAARTALQAASDEMRGMGWTVSPIERAGWSGVVFKKAGSAATWSVILREHVLAVISGQGEVERFLAVTEGRAISLAESAHGEVATAAASSPQVALGLSAGFRRITRELGAKGLPPFFLRMINDLRAISATVSCRPDGATIALEVQL
ncbi:MAG: hypothetical protein QF464_19730, partial [Myxococcota bacterium]|nr:hypothetical protein [Myxococcota bacterium]